MQEALIAVGFLVVAALIGAVLKPNEDQSKPLWPEASSAAPGHDDHNH